MSVYYNENDPLMAAWLRELIADKQIPDGVVDERSITKVSPCELAGFVHCHFFAGVGVWPFALQRAGWPADREIWTGSCPCQPFSVIGAQKGLADERHLWPQFSRLIDQRRPGVVIGEQVASHDVIGKVKSVLAGKDSTAWLDVVLSDLERALYTCGAVVTPAAGVGAPHIRQRTWWLGVASEPRLEGYGRDGDHGEEPGRIGTQSGGSAAQAGGVDWTRPVKCADQCRACPYCEEPFCDECDAHYADCACPGPDSDQWLDETIAQEPGATNGFWADAQWIWCRDEKRRAVESGLEPLVNGPADRVVRGGDPGTPIDAQKSGEARTMRLHGYGNALCAPSAIAFVESVMEILPNE